VNNSIASDQIDAYQAVATNRSPFSAVRIGRWTTASTKGPQATTPGPAANVSQDHLVIGAILVGGLVWFVYRRRIAKAAKKVENQV
jgi:hypothetical protein